LASVADPDSFFTDPDPGIFFQSGSRPKTHFSKAVTKFWEKHLFSTKKVGILLNREFLFGRYHLKKSE